MLCRYSTSKEVKINLTRLNLRDTACMQAKAMSVGLYLLSWTKRSASCPDEGIRYHSRKKSLMG